MKSKARKAIELAYERGYRVTDDGVVIGQKGKPLNVRSYGNQRYPVFTLNRVPFTESSKKSVRVHQFAAYCFYGENMFEEGVRVRHLNDDPNDFRRENIVLGTEKENKADIPPRKRTEMVARKLNYEQVKEIRSKRRKGMSYRKISEEYEVSYACAWDVVNMRSWTFKEGA